MRILLFILSVLWPASACAQDSDPRTEWIVTSASGLDALLLVGAAAGDELQAEYYPDETANMRRSLSPEALAALDRLGAGARASGRLLGPYLVLLFSSVENPTLENVIAAARDPETLLRPPFEATVYWDGDDWPATRAFLPALVRVLDEMQAAGFEADWQTGAEPEIDAAITRISASVSGQDVITQQARLLGRSLDPEIHIVVVYYSQPYGIRVQGQRFLAHHSYDAETQLRIAAHEIFHPPFDPDDGELARLLSDLEADPWIQSIVNDHDPAYGYNSFMGVVDEDSTEALDQIVSERLGFARDPGERWRRADGGMHMFAAAAWHAMVEDGFVETGGTYSDWLKSALRRGLLSPSEVRRRAAEVVGEETVNQWGPHRREIGAE